LTSGVSSTFNLHPKGPLLSDILHEGVERVTDDMRCKQGEMWKDHSLILHDDNVPAHSSLQVAQILAGKGTSAKDHFPYSPDFWLIPKLKAYAERKVFLRCQGSVSSVTKILTFLFMIRKLL
jgi:hypothetical protein